MNFKKEIIFLTLILSINISFSQVSFGGQPVQYEFGFSANDPLLSKNPWITYLFYNDPELKFAIEGAGTSLSVAENDNQCHYVQDTWEVTPRALWQFPPSCDEYDQLVRAQILLNSTAKKGPELAVILSTGSYTKAWAYAAQNNLAALIETPVGFQILGQKPFTLAQMKAFYLAAKPYWNGSILGENPYSPTLWGDPSKLGGDAVTNFSTAGDNHYPDIARFAGKQPSEGFLYKWGIPIIQAVVIAAVTMGVGDAVAAGIDAGLGATTSTVSTVAADGSIMVSSSVTTAGGTLLSTSISTLASDGSLIAGSTIATSTVAGTAITVGSGILASTAAAALEGQSPARAFALGILGGAAMGFVNSEFSSGSPSLTPGSYVSQSLENMNVSNSAADFIGGTLNLTLQNSVQGFPGSATRPILPSTPSLPLPFEDLNSSALKSRRPASVEPLRKSIPHTNKVLFWNLGDF